MSGFAALHPTVNFIYFVLVLVMAFAASHPVLLGLGLVCAACNALVCMGKTRFWGQLRLLLPLLIFTALLNPVLSSKGETVLFVFPWGSACTAESLLYGLCTAVRLASVILWFGVWNAVVTTDKFTFLFGRFLPSTALTVCMGLRLVPRLLGRLREVSDVQKCLDPSAKGLKHAGRCVSVVITWALENAIDTADSMKSRGYGLKGRSHFSIYRFTREDALCLCLALVFGAACIVPLFTGAADAEFFPRLQMEGSMTTVLSAVSYVLLGFCPMIFEAKEALAWRASK